MPVNYSSPDAGQLLPVLGVELGTAAAAIKNWSRDDVLLIHVAPGAQAAGVFTRNAFCAAPVLVCREVLSRRRDVRALIVNAGNANAGTGAQGLADARACCEAVASALGCEAAQVLPFSTGVIMEPLPVGKIVAAVPQCVARLTEHNWLAAVRAIMTTDTVPKGASRSISVDGASVSITGIAKGSGMIAPNMATMLGFVATDAPIAGDLLPALAGDIADESFNRVTIDGDTSTNDSFILLASHRAKLNPIDSAADPRLGVVRAGLIEVAAELAQAIVRDGEGATKFITITVEQGRDEDECVRVARAIANSPLVKTAFFASDPNLGRIVCAIGNASVADLDPARVSFWLDDVQVVREGGRSSRYTEQAGKAVMANAEIVVRVTLGRGSARSTVWTCDLSHDYVSINADYRS